MVIFASEQLWPNVQGLVHWYRHRGRIKDLCIYYTDDPQKSAGPAGRFEGFARRVFPTISVHFPERPGGKLPHEVYQQIVSWQQQLPDRHWIINATGGLKLMFAGAIRALELPRTEVVYRELSGEWFRWSKTDHGEDLRPIEIDSSETDDIPVGDLVQVQSPIASQRQWYYTKPEPLPIKELVKHGFATAWNWRDMFKECGLDTNEQSGFLFERFVAAVLLNLGIKQVCLNAKLGEENGQSLQEIDVIANYRGRLLIFDCKLRVETEEGVRVESLSSQIRQAAAIHRDIGGLGARVLMIRPGRSFKPQERLLAAALQVDVLDCHQSLDFFRKIAEFCDYPEDLPEELAAAQKELDQAKAQGYLEAFAHSTLFRTRPRPGESGQTIIHLDGEFNEYLREHGQDWCVYKYLNQMFVFLALPKNLPLEEVRKRLSEAFRSYARVGSIRRSKLKRTGMAQLDLLTTEAEFKTLLGTLVGKKLF